MALEAREGACDAAHACVSWSYCIAMQYMLVCLGATASRCSTCPRITRLDALDALHAHVAFLARERLCPHQREERGRRREEVRERREARREDRRQRGQRGPKTKRTSEWRQERGPVVTQEIIARHTHCDTHYTHSFRHARIATHTRVTMQSFRHTPVLVPSVTPDSLSESQHAQPLKH